MLLVSGFDFERVAIPGYGAPALRRGWKFADKENTPELNFSRVFHYLEVFELLRSLDVIKVGPTSRNIS